MIKWTSISSWSQFAEVRLAVKNNTQIFGYPGRYETYWRDENSPIFVDLPTGSVTTFQVDEYQDLLECRADDVIRRNEDQVDSPSL